MGEIRKILHNITIGKNFLNRTPVPLEIILIDKWCLVKLRKASEQQEKQSDGRKDGLQNGKNVFASQAYDGE